MHPLRNIYSTLTWGAEDRVMLVTFGVAYEIVRMCYSCKPFHFIAGYRQCSDQYNFCAFHLIFIKNLEI